MAIVTGATQGIEVTTAAVDEVLATQAQANGVDEIVLSDTLANLENGQATNPTDYVGRMCILRQGLSNEETRLVTAEVAGTGTTRILTVGEPWVTVPAVSDTVHFSYSSDDMSALTGMTLNSLSGVYEGGVSREWQVGQGTVFAYLAVINFTSWRLPDRGTMDPGLTVRNNGRLDFGYVQAGEGIQGALVLAVNNSAGELSVEVEAGGILRCYSSFWKAALDALGLIVRSTADVDSKNWTIKDLTQDGLLLDGVYENLSVSGGGLSTDLLRLAEETTTNGLLAVDLAGITTESGDTTTETITIRDPVLINVSPLVIVEANKTVNLVNLDRVIEESDQSDLDFSNATSNAVNQQFSLDPVVQDSSGTKISGARVFLYEGTRLDDLVLELTSDVDGLAPGVWTYKNFTEDTATTLTVLTDGAHALRVDNYGDFPFIATQTSNEKFAGTVILNADPNIVEASQATAITAGSGVTFNTDANPSSLITYSAGANPLTVGAIVTGGASGAVGTVTQIVDGDNVAGTVHLSTRNGISFSGTEALSSDGTWTATLTLNSEQRFSKWIDANSKSFQVTHDYFGARSAEAPGSFTAEAEQIHEWGKENEERVLYLGLNGWFTNRSGTEGVIVVNGGAGAVDFFTDDAGGTFVPPSAVNVTLTVVESDGTPIQGAIVFLETKAGGPAAVGVEIFREVTNASGVVTTSYVFVGSQPVGGRVAKGTRLPVFEAADIVGLSIENDGLDAQITMGDD